MTIGEIRVLSFLKNSKRKNEIDIDISNATKLTRSQVIYFASKLEESKLVIDVSNKYQKNMQVTAWKISKEGMLKSNEINSTPKKEKLQKIPNLDGTFIFRPLMQDITPKCFEINPVSMILSFETPTERRMLWMIAHYPYLLNYFFLDDANKDKDGNFKINPKIEDALKMLHSIKMKHYIKQSDDLLTWKLTRKGQLARLTTHPQWIFIQLFLGAFLAFLVALSILFISKAIGR